MDISKIDLQVEAQNALEAYCILPTSTEILARMVLVRSPQDAVQQIIAAQNEAWDLRKALASSWTRALLFKVEKLLIKKIGSTTVGSQKTHPLLGPIFAVRYPNGIWEEFRRQILENLEEIATTEKIQRSLLRNRESQKAAAKRTNEVKEAKRMRECVDNFVNWLKTTGKRPSAQLISEFPKVPGMSSTRSQSVLKTLFSAQSYPSVRCDLLQTLRKDGFPNVTQAAVDECLQIMEKCVNV